ncbi:ABC transporter ATP-binding protein [Labrenzia sp. OB1]|uniref:ABC transporter ATP-binding protein n=1 Tax=Labrenzia sp. OB1 TaxID=1561204 RepID=UPI0007B1F067|nr:ABC transporter ATP-binding protein [Labrenzia sp. OB1]KZM50525.1 peptide ABC transporter ATP-binding protein [Labrenzia sp. OB1]
MADASADVTLRISGLKVSVGSSRVVDGVNIDIGKGEIVALVGESGSGKSLTALSAMGLLSGRVVQSGGDILLNGERIDPLDEQEMSRLRGTRISMIFQEPIASLNPLLSVGEQVAESLFVHGRAGRREAWSQAVQMLADVGIPEPEKRARQFAWELSGGMCQRVMIASALIAEPDLLIADEPTTALDVTVQAQILDLMRRLRDKTGTSILFITHDMGVVASIADRVCVMYGGRVVEQAEVHQLFQAPKHPYTKLLLTTIPKISDTPKAELYSIKGTVPDINAFPKGCRFRTRCPLADDVCLLPPELEAATGAQGGLVACWHSDMTETLQ